MEDRMSDDATPDPNDPNPQTATVSGPDNYEQFRAKYIRLKQANKEQNKIICWLKGKLRKY